LNIRNRILKYVMTHGTELDMLPIRVGNIGSGTIAMHNVRIQALILSLTVVCTIVGVSGARAQSSEAELARKLANPIANLITVPIVTNYDEGYGTGDGHRVVTNVQPLIPIELNKDWLLLSRTIIPIVWDQNNISPFGPSGSQSGFGDISESVWFSPSQSTPVGSLGNFTWGAGAVALLPTGNADPLLGTGKWGFGPTAIGLFVKGGWTYGALTNHIWDVAGKSNRADVSLTLVQPWIAYTTKNAVTLALEAESTYDWTTNEWSVPINATLSKLMTIGKQAVSFEVGLRYWADNPAGAPRPDDLGYRFNVTFLFPS
jgi:hypothetical protein